MEKQKYLEDLQDIKSIMDRSSRFISLSGMSGIVAGVLALLGAYLAYQTVYEHQNYLDYRRVQLTTYRFLTLLAIASGLLVLSVGAGLYFTQKKTRKTNQKLWDNQSKRLVVNLLIPLVVGGILCLILISKGFIWLVAPMTLIFYGLGLINASKYTLTEIRSLGLMEVALGLIGCQFAGYGLILWAIGFGVLHIIYGLLMHVKYGS